MTGREQVRIERQTEKTFGGAECRRTDLFSEINQRPRYPKSFLSPGYHVTAGSQDLFDLCVWTVLVC